MIDYKAGPRDILMGRTLGKNFNCNFNAKWMVDGETKHIKSPYPKLECMCRCAGRQAKKRWEATTGHPSVCRGESMGAWLHTSPWTRSPDPCQWKSPGRPAKSAKVCSVWGCVGLVENNVLSLSLFKMPWNFPSSSPSAYTSNLIKFPKVGCVGEHIHTH